MLRIFCFYILLLIFFPNAAFSAVANTNADSGTACSSSSPMMTADGSCRATPSKYEAQIYEMGLCTSDPFDNGNNATFDSSTCTVVYSDTSPSAVDLAATLGSGLTLPGTSSRPANGRIIVAPAKAKPIPIARQVNAITDTKSKLVFQLVD